MTDPKQHIPIVERDEPSGVPVWLSVLCIVAILAAFLAAGYLCGRMP